MSEPPTKKPKQGWGDGPLYLGFDVSTQSCKALVMDRELAVVGISRVQYDTDLPHHSTVAGCHRGEGGRVTSPTRMWVEAMELALDRLKEQGCPFSRVCAISGSGQQHGSVYWSHAGVKALQGLDPTGASAAEQLRNAFVTESSPIWMDTSTTASCRELTELAGGALGVAAWTGSTAQERFTGHHFRRFAVEHGLADVGALSLVSSLGASLLVGDVVAVDISDAAGMNLMDIRTKRWHEELLHFVAPGQVAALRAALAEPQDSWNVCGRVHSFWVQRYGFSAGCKVVAWSGDNACAVVGNGLVREGDVAISLGTSDTALSVLPQLPEAPLPFGHLFPHPTLEGAYWSMLCYTNGDVTRRRVRDEFFASSPDDWSAFSEALRATPPGNGGCVGLYFTTDEITPAISNGPDFRGEDVLDGKWRSLDSLDDPQRIEMRALAIKNHLEKLMPGLLTRTGDEAPHLVLTGGAASNLDILQVFADVFQRPVRCLASTEGAAFGAAVRALHAAEPEVAQGIGERLRSLSTVHALPRSDLPPSVYQRTAQAFAALEAKAVRERGRL